MSSAIVFIPSGKPLIVIKIEEKMQSLSVDLQNWKERPYGRTPPVGRHQTPLAAHVRLLLSPTRL